MPLELYIASERTRFVPFFFNRRLLALRRSSLSLSGTRTVPPFPSSAESNSLPGSWSTFVSFKFDQRSNLDILQSSRSAKAIFIVVNTDCPIRTVRGQLCFSNIYQSLSDLFKDSQLVLVRVPAPCLPNGYSSWGNNVEILFVTLRWVAFIDFFKLGALDLSCWLLCVNFSKSICVSSSTTTPHFHSVPFSLS